jgi:hypothetical protein
MQVQFISIQSIDIASFFIIKQNFVQFIYMIDINYFLVRLELAFIKVLIF